MKNTKICKTCNEEKNILDFHKHRGNCKVCFRKIAKKKTLNKLQKTDPERAKNLIEYRKELESKEECPDGYHWCYDCKKYLEDDDFSPNQRKLKNRGRCVRCSTKHNIETTRLLKKKAINYLGGKCVDCGYQGHYASFHFHHIKPEEKTMTWGGNGMRHRSWNNIIKELDKCSLMCANCHEIIHCTLNDDGTTNENYIKGKG